MKRFRFRLDKVLRIRVHAERLAKENLASELSALATLEESLDRCRSSMEACRDADGLAVAASLARALEQGMKRTAGRIGEAMVLVEQRVEQARLAFQERRRDVKAMQSLRDRRFAAWREETLRAEQAEFDEVARTRFVARRQAAKVQEGSRT